VSGDASSREAMPMLALIARFFLGCALEYDQVR